MIAQWHRAYYSLATIFSSGGRPDPGLYRVARCLALHTTSHLFQLHPRAVDLHARKMEPKKSKLIACRICQEVFRVFRVRLPAGVSMVAIEG